MTDTKDVLEREKADGRAVSDRNRDKRFSPSKKKTECWDQKSDDDFDQGSRR